MPFIKSLTEIYESLVKPAVESQGLNCRRADDFKNNRTIMEDIWKRICEARIVIADLTDFNANVMYELGIAHTLGKSVILIYQQGSDTEFKFPFDLTHIRRIQYQDNATGGKRLERELSETLKTILSEESKKNEE